ncbi:MAG: TonB family protein, partial [Bacteroidetes bacterium]|nr:TonB family protein [Fibrella sp.]
MATGELTQIRLVHSSDSGLDQTALRAVSNMPRWYPAHREGMAVSCLYELPITFRFD